MPTFRQSIVARMTRLYPFYSGCGRLSNSELITNLAGTSPERVWARVSGGEVIASLNDYVGRAAFYVGDLDRKITWICKRIVRPGDTVLDIGANIGIVTILLSHLVGDKGIVHSFEPNPILQDALEKTLLRNQALNVRLHRMALGENAGSLELRIPKDNAGAASLIRNRDKGGCDVAQVPVCPLDVVFSGERIKGIRLIKIDVEGFEAEVLRGARQLFSSIRPEAILFELNEKIEGPISDQPVIKVLREYGYRFFSIPKCLLRMHLKRFDPDSAGQLIGHDLLATPEGPCCENIADLLGLPSDQCSRKEK